MEGWRVGDYGCLEAWMLGGFVVVVAAFRLRIVVGSRGLQSAVFKGTKMRSQLKKVIVLGAIIEKDGKILLARRGPGLSMSGKWEFPGGKLEVGENDKDCLQRELMEEMKVDLEVEELFAESKVDVDGKMIFLKCYKCKLVSDKIQLTDHDEIAWVKPEGLLSYDLASADIPIARKIAGG